MSTRPHWLGGWGFSPEATTLRLSKFLDPAVVLAPTSANLARLLATPAATPLGGWSLGAHHLLLAMAASPELFAGRSVTLACPFLSFPAEAGAGGRVHLAQLRMIRKWLRNDAGAALADFRKRAGLGECSAPSLPYPLEGLLEGLDFLEKTDAPDPTPGLLACSSARLFGGEKDPLIDNALLQKSLPALRITPGAGHDLADFAAMIAGA